MFAKKLLQQPQLTRKIMAMEIQLDVDTCLTRYRGLDCHVGFPKGGVLCGRRRTKAAAPFCASKRSGFTFTAGLLLLPLRHTPPSFAFLHLSSHALQSPNACCACDIDGAAPWTSASYAWRWDHDLLCNCKRRAETCPC